MTHNVDTQTHKSTCRYVQIVLRQGGLLVEEMGATEEISIKFQVIQNPKKKSSFYHHCITVKKYCSKISF